MDTHERIVISVTRLLVRLPPAMPWDEGLIGLAARSVIVLSSVAALGGSTVGNVRLAPRGTAMVAVMSR
jgi:hypothetical protein